MTNVFKILISVFIISITSCSQITNVSYQEPYKLAIGKHFIIQKDLYIYEFNDPGSSLRIGPANEMANYSIGIPKVIDEKYIGIKGQYITIKGVVRKGSFFTINRVIKTQSFEDLVYTYCILLDGNLITKEIDTDDIVNIFKNPPITTTWSDPPIFDAKYALPLSSDAIWWK